MSQNLDLYGGNYTTTKAGFSAGTTSTLTTANVSQLAIGGKSYSKTAVSNAAAPTTDARSGLVFTAVPPNFGCVFTLGFNAAGTLLAVQGDIKSLDVGGLFTDAPQFGSTPDTFCPCGYLVVKAGATASAWTFGASNTAGATGVTYTFVDVLTMPARPQVA
jgi:hypothetical protein